MKNTAILVHGPRACVYHINYILGMRGSRPGTIYSTSLSEHDVIFGAETKLTETLEQLDADLHPDLICILSCCASDIIGEDAKAAVQKASLSARTVVFDYGGFEGDHAGGYRDSLAVLARTLAGSQGRVDRHSVNLIGVLRSGPDLKELKRLLSLMQVEVNSVLCAGAGIKDLERLGDAELNLVLCETSGSGAAEILEERFGTPYRVLDLPIGKIATDSFLMRIGEELGVDPAPAMRGSNMVADFNTDVRIALFCGPTRAVAFSKFFSVLGYTPRLIVVDFSSPSLEHIREIIGDECELLEDPDHEEIIQKLQYHRINLVFGGLAERSLAGMLGIPHIDMMHGDQKTIGYEGANRLISLMKEALNKK